MVYLVIFGITLLTASLIEFGWRQVMFNAAFNLLTVLLLWLLLHIYSRLRKMRLSEMAGGGDLAFLLTVVPYFEPYDYVLFLVVSSMLTLADGGRQESEDSDAGKSLWLQGWARVLEL